MTIDRHAAGTAERMIPGAFEHRDRRPAAPPAATPHLTPYVPTTVARRRSILERVWRYVMRPTDTPPS